LQFSPNGNDITIGHTGTPFISAYPRSAGFGTKYANPASLPNNVFSWYSKFSPSGNDVFVV